MILYGGTYGGKQILKSETVDFIFTDFNARIPGDARSVGLREAVGYWIVKSFGRDISFPV
jgi:hypothetical protein